MSIKTNKFFVGFLVVLFLIVFYLALQDIVLDHHYKIVLQDGITVNYSGHCYALHDRVDCKGQIFYDVKSFEEIK